VSAVAQGPLAFDSKTISDQKRLVRGEHYLRARSLLRARDHVHHAKWRILIAAGGAPQGEVTAIRELMPKAHITAVDRDPRCLEAAITAGVDDVVQCDLSEFTGPIAQFSIGPAIGIRNLDRFDIICLDLCGGVNPTSKDILKAYRPMVTTGGVFIFTFSYGRDVIEAIKRAPCREWLVKAGASELLARRIGYLINVTTSKAMSVMVYRGKEMPMCSLLIGGDVNSFVQVEPGDFELAVCYPNAADLYDCPQERIESLRRQFAAIKAALTRKAAETSKDRLFA
jgi:SAM-dependent methyltransferase